MTASSETGTAAFRWRGSERAVAARALRQAQEESTRLVLALAGVSVAYGERCVLRNIDCTFREGKITAILGPSGCGKSTLLRVLNRTLELIPRARLLSGTVAFRGEGLYDRSAHPAAVRKRIGLIHQRPVPFPMSILEDILFGARYHGLIRGAAPIEYARCYLEQVGLWNEVKDRLRDRAEQLSGGQQQRLCLARTLANQPEVILMDEPCSSLDPAATQQIEELILGLKSRYTMIIVTHNLAQAKRISDDAIFMLDGEIIEQGSTQEIFNSPCSNLTRDFVSGHIG
jgi:phosphate transport system ATP-binding protein